ncbi:hypothetical protein O181_117892, partial [Austropuccinia psidii MF-1]|nr:hypothetical protein [Austropuccinia psidii MF-1]
MVTSLLDWRKVIIWLMKDGNGKRKFKLGRIITMYCHPWDSNAKLHGNRFQAQVAPEGWRTYSANPSNPMSHLFQAQINPQNDMRTLRLVSLNLRWLRPNPQRNLLLWKEFSELLGGCP